MTDKERALLALVASVLATLSLRAGMADTAKELQRALDEVVKR